MPGQTELLLNFFQAQGKRLASQERRSGLVCCNIVVKWLTHCYSGQMPLFKFSTSFQCTFILLKSIQQTAGFPFLRLVYFIYMSASYICMHACVPCACLVPWGQKVLDSPGSGGWTRCFLPVGSQPAQPADKYNQMTKSRFVEIHSHC